MVPHGSFGVYAGVIRSGRSKLTKSIPMLLVLQLQCRGSLVGPAAGGWELG